MNSGPGPTSYCRKLNVLKQTQAPLAKKTKENKGKQSLISTERCWTATPWSAMCCGKQNAGHKAPQEKLNMNFSCVKSSGMSGIIIDTLFYITLGVMYF